ncbi:MAG TPA: DUF1289 domain-containing protein [Thioalkalivibrio sp.]|nr:DUF1289 domain-containing protein [Thioalkalivibrio sp.]
MSGISTPCVQVCELGPDDRCVGCGRSRDEIAAWTRLPESARRAVMERLRAEGYPRRATEST